MQLQANNILVIYINFINIKIYFCEDLNVVAFNKDYPGLSLPVSEKLTETP